MNEDVDPERGVYDPVNDTSTSGPSHCEESAVFAGAAYEHRTDGKALDWVSDVPVYHFDRT